MDDNPFRVSREKSQVYDVKIMRSLQPGNGRITSVLSLPVSKRGRITIRRASISLTKK